MGRLLTTLSLILALLLFPPATLALISNNAIPGDATYPIKRGLEDVIFAVASITPVSKAWFAAARSDRRFKEFSSLIAQGKDISQSLNDLVEQTDDAVKETTEVNDSTQKQQLIRKLEESVQQYDQGLSQVQQQLPESEQNEKEGHGVLAPETPGPTASPLSEEDLKKARELVDHANPPGPPIPQGSEGPTYRYPGSTRPPETIPGGTSGKSQKIDDARRKLKEIKKRLKKEDSHLTPKLDTDKMKREKH